MTLIVRTVDPSGLLSDLKKAIQANEIQTWSVDSDGDFTHTPEQWKSKGWLRPKIEADKIQFGFLGNRNVITTSLIYAVYHGRFTEMLLNHFDKKISKIEATSLPTSLDFITNEVKK